MNILSTDEIEIVNKQMSSQPINLKPKSPQDKFAKLNKVGSKSKKSSSFFNLAGSIRHVSANFDGSSKKGSDRTSIRRVNIFQNSKANKITKKYYR